MAIYAIILNEPNDAVWQTVKSGWPGMQHFIVTDHLAFIAPSEPTLTDHIAEKIGMNSGAAVPVTGVVIEAKNRSGLNSSSLVEWLGKAS